jgi:hypothetical protein
MFTIFVYTYDKVCNAISMRFFLVWPNNPVMSSLYFYVSFLCRYWYFVYAFYVMKRVWTVKTEQNYLIFNCLCLRVRNLVRRWIINVLESYVRNVVGNSAITICSTRWNFEFFCTTVRFHVHRINVDIQIWLGLIVCKLVTVCPGHIWTTLYK